MDLSYITMALTVIYIAPKIEQFFIVEKLYSSKFCTSKYYKMKIGVLTNCGFRDSSFTFMEC